MTTIQSKLREGVSPEKLEEDYAIKIRSHILYPNLKLFKYNQIKSPFHEKIAREARGIILDENENWKIISYPYEKFFNFGESLAAKVDLDSLQVATKEDGSLMTLYYYDNHWHVASSGSPDASGPTRGQLSFKDLFWKVWADKEYKLPEDTNLCYMFELCTHYNRIVVEHFEARIILHGARNLVTLEEYHPIPLAEKYGWENVKFHELTDFDQIRNFAETFCPSENEGFIAMDKDFNRIKIKSTKYVAIHHLKTRQAHDDFAILQIIQTNESEEYLSYFPEYKEKHDEILLKYQKALERLEDLYEKVQDCETMKDFALTIKDEPLKSVIFSKKRKNISIVESLGSIPAKSLFPHLEL